MNTKIETLLQEIGAYGVQCSETKELAPSQSLVNAIDAVKDALRAQANQQAQPARELTNAEIDSINAEGKRNGLTSIERFRAVIAADHALRPSARTEIVGWIVHTDDITTAALYPLSQRDAAFEAASRWGASITAVSIHPSCPVIAADRAIRQPQAEGMVLVPVEPTEEMWGELARDIMFVLRRTAPKPKDIFYHLEHLGREIPQWLRDEPEMGNLDHTMSKGTCCVLIYKAMIAASQEEQGK